MRASHERAEQRYEQFRKLAWEIAERSAPEGVRYRSIDLAAREASLEWSKGNRQVSWNWKDHIKYLQYRYPKHFEVALWQDASLICLSFGRPTYEGTALRLDRIEARPLDLGNRITVFPSIEIAYEIYARLINAREIRITQPVNQEVRAYYESHNYQYVPRRDYLYREVI